MLFLLRVEHKRKKYFSLYISEFQLNFLTWKPGSLFYRCVLFYLCQQEVISLLISLFQIIFSFFFIGILIKTNSLAMECLYECVCVCETGIPLLTLVGGLLLEGSWWNLMF